MKIPIPCLMIGNGGFTSKPDPRRSAFCASMVVGHLKVQVVRQCSPGGHGPNLPFLVNSRCTASQQSCSPVQPAYLAARPLHRHVFSTASADRDASAAAACSISVCRSVFLALLTRMLPHHLRETLSSAFWQAHQSFATFATGVLAPTVESGHAKMAAARCCIQQPTTCARPASVFMCMAIRA